MGDRAAAEKYEVSVRSLEAWRSRLSSDDVLVEFFRNKKRLQDEAWGDQIPTALSGGIDFLKRSSQEADPKDPEAIHAIAGYIKILSDVAMTRKVIDARLAGQNREAGEEA